MKHLLFTLILLLAVPYVYGQTNAPSSSKRKDRIEAGWQHNHYLMASVRYENGRRDWTSTPLQYKYALAYQFKSGLAPQLRTYFKYWGYLDEFLFPAIFGLGYTLPVSDRIALAPSIGVGPALLIGNDYGGFFAISHFGFQVELGVGKQGKKMLVATHYSQFPLGHSDESDLLDILLGIRF